MESQNAGVKEMTCLNCGKELTGKQRKYCSHKCQQRLYYRAHREYYREVDRRYRAEHREERIAAGREYRARHREELNRKARERYWQHKW